jgi:hypothetical protein
VSLLDNKSKTGSPINNVIQGLGDEPLSLSVSPEEQNLDLSTRRGAIERLFRIAAMTIVSTEVAVLVTGCDGNKGTVVSGQDKYSAQTSVNVITAEKKPDPREIARNPYKTNPESKGLEQLKLDILALRELFDDLNGGPNSALAQYSSKGDLKSVDRLMSAFLKFDAARSTIRTRLEKEFPEHEALIRTGSASKAVVISLDYASGSTKSSSDAPDSASFINPNFPLPHKALAVIYRVSGEVFEHKKLISGLSKSFTVSLTDFEITKREHKLKRIRRELDTTKVLLDLLVQDQGIELQAKVGSDLSR